MTLSRLGKIGIKGHKNMVYFLNVRCTNRVFIIVPIFLIYLPKITNCFEQIITFLIWIGEQRRNPERRYFYRNVPGDVSFNTILWIAHYSHLKRLSIAPAHCFCPLFMKKNSSGRFKQGFSVYRDVLIYYKKNLVKTLNLSSTCWKDACFLQLFLDTKEDPQSLSNPSVWATNKLLHFSWPSTYIKFDKFYEWI